MKALLKLFYFLLFVVILILLAGIFLPKTMHFKKEISVHAGADLLFDQINIPVNWIKWSPWLDSVSVQKLSHNAVGSGEGSSLEWSSDLYGRGKVEIRESSRNSKVGGTMDLGDLGKANFQFRLNEQGENTLLSFEFSNQGIGYFERYFLYLFRQQMEDTFLDGLYTIKKETEALRLSRISDPLLIEGDPIVLMMIVDTVETSALKEAQEAAFEKMDKYLERRKIDKAGDPTSLFYTYDPSGKTIFATGYPIEKKTWGWKSYQCLEINAGKRATLTHWGDFSSAKPYLALDEFLLQNKLEQDSFIWESYQIREQDQPDTSLWQKQLFYPVRE